MGAFKMRFTKPSVLAAWIALALPGAIVAQSPTYKVGRPPTEAELRAWDNVVGGDGKELPPGAGSAVDGAKVYATKCVFCHGATLTEGPAPRLVGGIDSLSTRSPLLTVGSFWPYATTVWDYINRSMPQGAEGSLTPDQIYAVTAFVLFKNGIVKESDVLDAKSLLKVQMPNRDGFYPAKPEATAKNGNWKPNQNQAKPAPR
jgi:S-disulfanyl-L-cysteine oxidoreductase SoxD